MGWKGGEAEGGNRGPLNVAHRDEAIGKAALGEQQIQSRQQNCG